MFEHLRDRERNYGFLNRSIPLLYSITTHPVLMHINGHYWNPFPGQALDFRLSGSLAGTMMYLAGDKNKKLEFLAAMSPAIVGSLDEVVNFFHHVGGMETNAMDGKDAIAYFLGALLAYGATKLIRKSIQYLKNRTKVNESPIPEAD